MPPTTPDHPKATTRHLLFVGATSYRYLWAHRHATDQQGPWPSNSRELRVFSEQSLTAIT